MPANAWTSLEAAAEKMDAKVVPIAPGPLPSPPEPDGVVFLRGCDITPEPVEWDWHGWLARRKFHVLAGAPGQGKTTIALAFAATKTSGGRWPDGSRCRVGNVLIWSGEDDAADTLAPRLIGMGADMSRVYFVSGTRLGGELLSFDPARDLVQLTLEAERIGSVDLLIVDPMVSAVAGDSHKNGEVRRALQPLVDLGARLNAAVLGITHFSKGSAGKDPVERVTGSIAFGAVARIVMCAAKAKGQVGEEDRRILARSKSNIGPDDGGIEYAIDQVALDAFPDVIASRIVWGQTIDGTARELLADAEANQDQDDDSPADVEAFVRGCLAGGPIPAKAFQVDAVGAGYAWRTVQRIAKRLGAESRKDGMHGGWRWGFHNAPKAPTSPEGVEGANFSRLASSASSVTPSAEEEVF